MSCSLKFLKMFMCQHVASCGHTLIFSPWGAVFPHRVQVSIVARPFMKAAACCVPWAT